jgi:O-antigen/teichoic acid export membrane protein
VPEPHRRLTIPYTSRFRINLGVSAGGKIVQVLSTFAQVPLFLHFLGLEQYGVWLILAAIPAWLALSDMGFTAVAANEIVMRAGRLDWNGAEQMLHSAFLTVIIQSIVVLAVTSTALVVLDLSSFLTVNPVEWSELHAPAFVLVLVSLLSLQSGLGAGLLRAAGRGDLALLAMGAKPLLDLICVATGFLWSPSILAAAFALLAAQVIYVVVTLALGLGLCPRIHFGVRLAEWVDIRYCLHAGLAFFCVPMANIVLLQGPTLLIAAMAGPAAVVIFSTCRTLARSAQQFLNLVGQSAWPEFTMLYARGERGGMGQLLAKSTLLNLVIIAVISSGLIFFGSQVVHVWTAGRVEPDRLLILAFVVSGITNAFWFAGSTLLLAINQHHRYAPWYLLAALVNIPIMAAAYKVGELPALGLALIFTDLIIAPIIIGACLNVLGISMRDLLVDIKSAANRFRGLANFRLHARK